MPASSGEMLRKIKSLRVSHCLIHRPSNFDKQCLERGLLASFVATFLELQCISDLRFLELRYPQLVPERAGNSCGWSSLSVLSLWFRIKKTWGHMVSWVMSGVRPEKRLPWSYVN